MSLFDKVAFGVAALLLIPILISPLGWAFGLLLALGWLVIWYGGRYALDLEKQRRQGERGMAHDVRMRGRRGNE